MKMSEKTDEKSGRRSSLKNIKWLAHNLGISRNTIHQWVLEGHVPYINLGVDGGRRIIRFCPEAIEAWLQERSYQSSKDDPNQANLKEALDADKQNPE
jgi:predicted DNA-binding transcriptional regulator AlpA